MNEGEFVGATAGPIEFTSCFTSSATVPSSPMRGVTVRITPASRYSTVWLSPAVVVVVVVVLVAAATWPVVWLVTTGTEVETLMTAFLFSDSHLRAKKLADDTLVVITGDHGEA